MTFRNYRTLPPDVNAQINAVTEIWRCHLDRALIGIYLYGSIALERYVEGRGDVDFLVVSGRHIPRDERLSLAEKIIRADRRPSPLEMSALYAEDLRPWKHPVPCQFHYSAAWTERYQKMLSGEIERNFIIDEDFGDPDIACHVHLVNQSGLCLYGRPARDVFPPVPEVDFWASLTGDIETFDFNGHTEIDPECLASGILCLGRVLSYKRERKILSKYDSALWALNHVPERFHYLIQGALGTWYSDETPPPYKAGDLRDFRDFMLAEIAGPLM